MEPNDFQQFVDDVRKQFYSAGGRPDHQSIRELMTQSSCKFTKVNWKQYAKFDETTNYTRNFVDGNDEQGYNLLILCWNPGKGSPIHDHDESACFLLVLDGELEETKYAVPTEGQPLNMTEKRVHSKGTLTYMDNTIGLHCVKNPSDTEGAVSLHLYFPPLTRCLVYDEEGKGTLRPIPVKKTQ